MPAMFLLFLYLAIAVECSVTPLSELFRSSSHRQSVLQKHQVKDITDVKALFEQNDDLRARLLNLSTYRRPTYEGYTFDPCAYHEDCISTNVTDRLCIRGDFTGPCSGGNPCFCFPELLQICKTCEDCLEFPKETCANNYDAKKTDDNFCVSTYVIWEGTLEEIGCDSFPSYDPTPYYLPSPTPVTNDDDPGGLVPESSDAPEADPVDPPGGSPIPSKAADSDEDNSGGGGDRPSGNEGSSDDDSRRPPLICVDADALKHLHPSQLVYPEHRLASVLCDQHGNCATPGHMVVYQGTPMMMRLYCDNVPSGCSRRVKHVNSPRFQKGMRIPSKSSSLQFTSLAARWETHLEHYFLSMALRIVL